MREGILRDETSKAANDINPRWKLVGIANECSVFTFNDYNVLFSIEQHLSGRWKHASLTMARAELPSWGDISMMKNDFFGRDAYAIQILPPSSEYVNAHKYCMHLWQYLDGLKWPIPETVLSN